ncbi:MAG TPA: hypothetical protein VGW32_03265, partial [Pyrinomonadaceae bacterium]|nr:hypothetical protein [Pyrinomonadaceae bacterium]
DNVPDIVIEKHTTSHVLMEEEVITEPKTTSVIDTEWTPARLIGNTESGLTSHQLVARQDDEVWRRRRLHIAWLTAVLGLLFVCAVGFWVYQSRKQALPAAAPLPSQQITMRRFTTAGGVPYRAVISPDGKSLVYMQRLHGKDSLWLGQIETNSSVTINQLSHTWYGYPVFAPDGGSIYFTVQNENYPQWTLLRMPALGGALTELIRNVHSPVTFSPDGRQVAFLREDDETNQTAIVIADAADGKRERMLVARRNAERFSTYGLSWSPDGEIIAVAAVNGDNKREEILAVRVADGSVSKIGDRDWENVGNLVWLPDARGLVTIAAENFTHRGGGQIWLVTYPEGTTRQVTNDVTTYQTGSLSVSADGKLVVLSAHRNPEIWIAPNADMTQARLILQGAYARDEGSHGLAWTPDGRLLYTAYVGERQTIWAMNSDGSNPQQLTSSASDSSFDNQMSVRANGRYMVFHSNRSGSSEIWRANTDGSDLKQLTAGGGNSQPSLSPDGQWIVYASARDGKSTLWRISIDGGEATQLTARRLSWPEVSPDGKHIACIDPTTLPRWRLTVIPFAGGEPVKSFAVPESAFLERRLRWTRDGAAIMYMDGQQQGLWRQALDDEKPQPVKGFEEVPIFQFTWSLDGKDLTYTTGKVTREIIIIENFR